jgi:hypothetical protein
VCLSPLLRSVVVVSQVVGAHVYKETDGSFASRSKVMRQEKTTQTKAAREQAAFPHRIRKPSDPAYSNLGE